MRKIIHIDCDCFFAAVEQLDFPQLKGKAIAVGGQGKRGVVATANYEARKFGVHSAMPGFQAIAACPELIFVTPRMARYLEISQQIQQIFSEYSPLIEPLSLDEAYLDVSDNTLFNGSASLLAKHIQQRIKNEIGITVSVGIASNKLLAKIASDWQKPQGCTLIAPHQVDCFMQHLPVGKLWGVGKKAVAKLAQCQIHTCGELQLKSESQLIDLFGQMGARLYTMCRGFDQRPVSNQRVRKSISCEHTYSQNLLNQAACLAQSSPLLEAFNKRFRNRQSPYNKARLKMKFFDFSQTSVELSCTQLNIETIHKLIKIAWTRQAKPVRLLGIGVRLCDQSGAQLELFPTCEAPQLT